MSVWTEEQFEIVHQHFPGEAAPAFESDEMQSLVWGRRWGVFNDVGRLRTVLVHRPGDELRTVDPSMRHPDAPALVHPEAKWYFWGEDAPDIEQMQREHDALTAALVANDIEIVTLDEPRPDDINAMFTRDMLIAVPGGAIIGRMGPLMRRGQELNVLRTLARIGMPVLATVHGTGTFEGGGFAMLDETHAVCAIGHRGNEEGARQVEQVLNTLGIELLRVHCRGWSCHIDGELVIHPHDRRRPDRGQLRHQLPHPRPRPRPDRRRLPAHDRTPPRRRHRGHPNPLRRVPQERRRPSLLDDAARARSVADPPMWISFAAASRWAWTGVCLANVRTS
jgi:N-dimethylarginine dimethylaminohydrolase